MTATRATARTLPIRWTDENAGPGPDAGRDARPIGWEPEYFLGARRAQPSAPALRALSRARAFTIASASLLALTLFHLLMR